MILSSKTDLTQPPNTPVPAGATPQYQCQLLDTTGTPVPLSALLTLTLSLMTADTPPAVVNAVSKKNILNTDRGTVSASCLVTVSLLAADTAIIDAPGGIELRSMIFDFTFTGTAGTQTGRHQVDFAIEQLSET